MPKSSYVIQGATALVVPATHGVTWLTPRGQEMIHRVIQSAKTPFLMLPNA
jgi:hypothetical protein